MHLPDLISDLAIILLTGGVVTVIFRKLNQPLVLGYILAGFLIGPYLPYFFTVADSESIATWSEIGIIILMFGLGLEFNLHTLMRVGGTGVITALTEVLGMLLLGYMVGQAMGWSGMDSLFLGGMLSMSSTTIIIKAFDDLKLRQERFAQLVFGTLVIEDIAGIFMMIILSTISVGQQVSGLQLGFKLSMLVLYLALWLMAGIYLLPTLLKKATPLMSDETLLVVSLGLCFGMVLLADSLGFSSALGAFLAGSLLAGTVQAERVEHLTHSVKDLFGAVFFISVGMMLDPSMIVRYIGPILLLSLVTILGKLMISSLGVLISGQSLETAIRCGCSLAQIGEFAFIIASLGLSLGVIADHIYPIIIAVSVLTTLTTPFFIKNAETIYRFVNRLLPTRLQNRLASGPAEGSGGENRDSDWGAYLRRYFKVLFLYGAIMAGLGIIGRRLMLPLVLRALPEFYAKLLTLALAWLLMAVFIRPMLDTRSAAYTALWVKSRGWRLPLMALSAMRMLIVVLLFFLPLRELLGLSSLWLLPLIFAFVLLVSRMGWFASAYLNVEARFLANLNERQLAELSESEEEALWLDEQLYVFSFTCPRVCAEHSLQSLGWGRRYGVNVIRIRHGRRIRNMPSGGVIPGEGDRVTVIGEKTGIESLCIELGLEQNKEMPTLRSFINNQRDSDNALYAYALPIEKGSRLDGSSIKTSAIRDDYSCMVLGLQRERLPLLQPDVNMVMHSGDLVWILGTRTMAGKVLSN